MGLPPIGWSGRDALRLYTPIAFRLPNRRLPKGSREIIGQRIVDLCRRDHFAASAGA